MSGEKIHEVAGCAMSVDHTALQVQPGKLEEAVKFFVEQLDWEHAPSRDVSGDWGAAKFVYHPSGNPCVQLLGGLGYCVLCDDTTPHLALKVCGDKQKVVEVSQAFISWGEINDIKVLAEVVNGGKIFISIEYLFAFDIELVP